MYQNVFFYKSFQPTESWLSKRYTSGLPVSREDGMLTYGFSLR